MYNKYITKSINIITDKRIGMQAGGRDGGQCITSRGKNEETRECNYSNVITTSGSWNIPYLYLPLRSDSH